MLPLRDENPCHHFPLFTIGLIIANALCFFYELSLGQGAEELVFQLGIVPTEIWNNENLPLSQAIPPYVTLLTSMFLHGGFAHLIGNMWFLWIFGDNLEDFLGHLPYMGFYLGTGLIAGLIHVWLSSKQSQIPTIGASGAISGVLGGYMVLFPRIRVKTLVTLGWFIEIIHVPAVFFLGLWLLGQFFGILAPQSSIAFGAHIGGFVAGAFLMFIFSAKATGSASHRYEPRRGHRWNHTQWY